MSNQRPTRTPDPTAAPNEVKAPSSKTIADATPPPPKSARRTAKAPAAEGAGEVLAHDLQAEERFTAMRGHAQALMVLMNTQSSFDRSDRDQTWRAYLSLVQDVLQFVDCAGAMMPVRDGSSVSPGELEVFGQLVRQRRESAGLSRSAVASRAKLSDATIKFIETAKTVPSRSTLSRLLRVTELALSWSEVPAARQPPDFIAAKTARAASESSKNAESTEPADTALNFYVPPSYDAVRMIAELARLLNGAGGHVEQTNVYLDHHSAAAYLAMCRHWPIAAAQRPLDVAAAKIREAAGDAPLTVIALGAGDGTTEVQFVQHLAAGCPKPDVELCLMDISQPLLTAAYKHAADTLSDYPGVHLWCLQGNFHHLPTYPQLQYKPSTSRRRRLYCAFGGTLANIDHEPRFFRDSLASVCGPGDILILDVQLAHGSVEDPLSIRAQDPALNAPLPKVHADWLSGPIFRCCPDVTGVDFTMRLDTQCPVPGSYSVEAIATVRSTQRHLRQFSMFRFKRYELARLSQCLQQLGWEPLLTLPFGPGAEKTACLLMFERR